MKIKRLSAILVLDSGLVVNSYNFNVHLPVGKLKFTLQRLQEFQIDEVVILNTSHSVNPISDFKGLLLDIDSWHIATPLSYGGGITSVNDAVEIVKAGAERVVISARLLLDAVTFFEMCNYLGEQAMILHLPLEFKADTVAVRGCGSMSLKSTIALLPDHWGGEIMFSFVANDGAKFPNWQNILIALQAALGWENLILAGGFSNPQDISKGLNLEQISAVAVGNFLHRAELSVVNLKQNIDVKIELRRQR